MNTTELIAAVRKDVFIGDTVFPDYTDADILIELNRTLQTIFTREVVNARQGYWLKKKYYTTVPGKAAYRIPERAVVGGLEQVALGSIGGTFSRLQEVTEARAQAYEAQAGGVGSVQRYALRGDWIELLPAPASAQTLQVSYYLRPSKLVLPVATGVVTGATATTLTLANRPANLPAAGGNAFDIVHRGGWNEVVYANMSEAVGGTATQIFIDPLLPDPFDYTRIDYTDANSDVVRLADETEFPCLPNEFHSTLAKLTAVTVMTQLNWLDKKSVTEQSAALEFSLFQNLLKPRVKADAEVLRAPRSVLQVGRGRS